MKVQLLVVPVVGVVAGDTAVYLCRGAFAVRQSLCSSVPSNLSDLVPSEIFACTSAMSPGDFASVLRAAPNNKYSLNFASAPLLSYSLSQVAANTTIRVSFGDCASTSALPWLEDGTNYMALILADTQSIADSVALNAGPSHTRDTIDVRATIRYYDVNGVADVNFRAKLADQLMGCQTSNGKICQLGFNTQVVAKAGTIELEMP